MLIRVQLIEAREDAHLWAQSYERDLRDFFSVQREIARTVAAEVHVALKPEREPLLAATRPVDPEALDLYLRARTLRGPSYARRELGAPGHRAARAVGGTRPRLRRRLGRAGRAHSGLGCPRLGAGSRTTS